jgi:hypothetical protein
MRKNRKPQEFSFRTVSPRKALRYASEPLHRLQLIDMRLNCGIGKAQKQQITLSRPMTAIL